MKQLEIILRKQDGKWVADTNLPGMPPAPRDEDWRVAVGLLMKTLVRESDTWGKIVHLPKWTVEQKDENVANHKEAYDEAIGISEARCMDVMVRVLLSEQKIHDYISARGLDDSDFMALIRRTLRGQQVARALYSGMINGLSHGVQQLHRQDADAKFKADMFGDDDA